MAMVVLSVGQCGVDETRIGEVVRRELGAEMEVAGSAEEARRMMGEKKYALVLVNRVLDESGESGVEFIGERKKAGEEVAMMLVSDYAEAQAAAVANGAVMGFGKGALWSAEAGERLRGVLGTAARPYRV